MPESNRGVRPHDKILPIIAKKVHQEKVQQEKLKVVKARLNFEETSRHSESGTLSKRKSLKERFKHRHARSMSESPEPRRGHSKSSRDKGSERRTMFKRLEKGVSHRLGDKEKNVSTHSRDSRHRSNHSSHGDTKSCYQSSRSRETEIASEKHRIKRESSRRTEALSESEGIVGGHWKSIPKKQKSSVEDDLSQPWILPIIAEKVHQEKVHQEKLKVVKARLNFEETSRHSESGTPSRRKSLKERFKHRHARSMSESPEPRCGHSKSSRDKGPERRTMFKRLEKGVSHKLGDKEKNVSAHSRDSRHRSNHSSRGDTKSCYQGSRSRETEIASEKHRIKRESSRRTEALSESEGIESIPRKLPPTKKIHQRPVEIHNIKQIDGESTEEFMRWYKLECRDVKGALKCMKISGFMHGIRNPELIKRLHDKIPKSVDEMMRVTTKFLRGEVAASNHERKKSFSSWKQQEARQKQNFKKGSFWNQQRTRRKQDRFTLLTKTPKEILALDKGKFKPYPPMTTPLEKRNASKFYEFHGEMGIPLTNELKQSSGKDQAKVAKKGETSKKDKPLPILMVQTWERLVRQKITQSFSSESVISFSPLGEEDGTEGPMIIETKMGGRYVHRMKAMGKENSGLLKFPVTGETVTLRSSKIITLECTMISGPGVPQPVINQVTEEKSQVAIHPEYPKQTIAIAGECAWISTKHVPKTAIVTRNRLEVESLGGYPFKCFINVYKGYHQIKMPEEDEEKTVFVTSQGIFCYSKMSFELKNARATYQRLVDKAFQKQIGRNWREGTFLGYKVDAGGARVCPDKVEAVLSLPSPRCLKDMQKLNGKPASLNRFLSKFAEKSLPLFKTLKTCTKKRDFQWTAEAEMAFKKIKQWIAELPMLAAPKEKEELIMYLVAAKEAISAILMTERDGKQIPIYFVSRALQGPKVNYTPMEKLILALVTRRLLKWRFELEEHDIHYRLRTSVKGQILADFVVERPKDDTLDTLMEDMKELSAPWILFTDGSSCINEYEALIAGLRIARQMRVQNLQANVDSKLLANQVNEVYVAKESSMIKYFEKVKNPASTFKEFSIKQVPRGENKKADARSKIASTSFTHLSKQLLVEELKEKPIDEKEVLAVIEEERHTWMTTVYEYLTKGILLEEKRKAMAIHRKAGRYAANYVLKEIHEGSCSMHSGPRSVVTKALRSGNSDRDWHANLKEYESQYNKNNEALGINLDLVEEKREQETIQEARSKAKIEKYYNARVRNTSFRSGDLVYRNNEASHAKDEGKLGPK
uniref:Reverse transcriptase domain-containing protein n=1 Tax=Tanacetum cinerariifolium TaxID=118510 RepID=A0A6L2N7H1_TANCI|nr:hypothetical protein [Tanacetum cinerariifolium]